jgi:hypothetical protein
MPEYILKNLMTGEEHELDFENISDIQAALEGIKAFNERKRPYNTKKRRKKILTWECFEDTLKRLSKVMIPTTDY